MVVWAGDDSPSKRNRQLSFFTSVLLAALKTSLLLLKEATKKAQYHAHVGMSMLYLRLQKRALVRS